ncbi:hypothetical protein A2765_05510 [Candidatus Kaiserbacteria bacterium RIFCSPHIGHO2_01_FULL_56_24]|uniref:PKD domain-containing protein n=1 Tax=Candidatus Kaiserbacteria bacterium RIFCSPHIGHO2_01_FULL_56_24 TaxID=1798487 RepID=A0A1F6DAN2_9BACT|nr:MAG: hypothetical protein A2765_05510 [Candidatus Kaiserbacteria bacterium RIFCSPHIGHO2_01_FULL_56_24]
MHNIFFRKRRGGCILDAMSALMRRGSLIFLPVVFFLALVASAHAESVVWNTSFGATQSYFRDLRYPNGGRPGLAGHGGWVQFSGTQDQITYRIQVTDVETGEILAPDASVPIEDHVKLEFVPHVYSDIWFVTSGGPQDSPYGYWVPGAAPPPITCTPADQVGSSWDGVGPQNSFVAHSVNPPAKTLTIPSGMTCDAPDADGSQVCSFNAQGSYTPVFNWAATNGSFYLRMTSPRFANGCMGSSNSYYNLAVPAQTMPFPLTTRAPLNPHAPLTPSVTAAACTIGEPETITMKSTDPDNGQIRYGIDWDDDGSTDQYAPSSGYVSSGTTQTASRIYALVGAKKVRVMAQDKDGNVSSWAKVSFTCAKPAEGTDTSAFLDLTPTDANGNPVDNFAVPVANLDLRAIPSLVKQGDTTKVNWSASNVKTCLVNGQNGDSWSGLLSLVGGNVSKPITGATTYTLSCIDLTGTSLTKQATVNVIPTFQEK